MYPQGKSSTKVGSILSWSLPPSVANPAFISSTSASATWCRSGSGVADAPRTSCSSFSAATDTFFDVFCTDIATTAPLRCRHWPLTRPDPPSGRGEHCTPNAYAIAIAKNSQPPRQSNPPDLEPQHSLLPRSLLVATQPMYNGTEVGSGSHAKEKRASSDPRAKLSWLRKAHPLRARFPSRLPFPYTFTGPPKGSESSLRLPNQRSSNRESFTSKALSSSGRPARRSLPSGNGGSKHKCNGYSYANPVIRRGPVLLSRLVWGLGRENCSRARSRGLYLFFSFLTQVNKIY
jgi:hypothetical protein